MRPRLTDAETIGMAVGGLVAITVAGLLGGIRGEVSQANAALALVLVVILAAYTGGRWAGVVTGVVAAVSFDFFLTAPYQSLAINSTNDIVTTALLVAVGLAVGHLAAGRREARADSQAGHDEVAGLYRVARLTADGADTADVVVATESEVAQVLHLRECHFVDGPAPPPLPELEPSGRVDAPYVFIGGDFTLPADGMAIPVRAGAQTHGWLECRPADPETGISGDRRRAALVLADHLGLVLAAGHSGTADPAADGSR